MYDYLFKTADEASAKAMLPELVIDLGGGQWSWDQSRVLATTRGAGAPMFTYIGTDPLDGYWVLANVPEVRNDLWALAMIEGNREGATITRTKYAADQMQLFWFSPVLDGMKYVWPGAAAAQLAAEAAQ